MIVGKQLDADFRSAEEVEVLIYKSKVGASDLLLYIPVDT